MHQAKLDYGLTAREMEVLLAMVSGLGSREIARKLGCSRHTVKQHLRHIYDKMGADNNVHAAVIVTKRGILEAIE